MKYENLKSLILTILVLTSLVLSWNLWTYQPSLDYTSNEKLLRNVEISKTEEPENIIRPSKILYHFDGVHYGTIENQEILRFTKEMKKWSLFDIDPTSTLIEEEEFIPFMHDNGKMEVIFPDEIPLETLRYLIGFTDEEVPNGTVDRILIDIYNQSEKSAPILHLVNYEDRRMYRAKVNNISLSTLKEKFYTPSVIYNEYVSIAAEEDRFIFIPKGPIELPRMNFLTDSINPDEFRDALFNDPSVVTKDQMNVGEVYTDSERFMSVDRTYTQLQYVNTVLPNEANSPDFNVIERGIDFVNEHSGWTDRFQFSRWNVSDADYERIVFQLHVGNYPVMNRDGLTEINQVWRNNEVSSYSRPIYQLGLEINDDPQTTILPPADQVERELNAMKNLDMSTVQDIRVGYELKREMDYQGVFILEPVWMYLDNNGWSKVIFTEKDELGGGM